MKIRYLFSTILNVHVQIFLKLLNVLIFCNLPTSFSCTYCLDSPSTFEMPTTRRELKSPLPTIDPGISLPVPLTGQCMAERSDNTCVWDDSNGENVLSTGVVVVLVVVVVVVVAVVVGIFVGRWR